MHPQLQQLLNAGLARINHRDKGLLAFHFTTQATTAGHIYALGVVVLQNGESIFAVNLYTANGLANRRKDTPHLREVIPTGAIILNAQPPGDQPLREALVALHQAFNAHWSQYSFGIFTGVDFNRDCSFLVTSYAPWADWQPVTADHERLHFRVNGQIMSVNNPLGRLRELRFQPEHYPLTPGWCEHRRGKKKVRTLYRANDQQQPTPVAQVLHTAVALGQAIAISNAGKPKGYFSAQVGSRFFAKPRNRWGQYL
jgi:hypothetical protein